MLLTVTCYCSQLYGIYRHFCPLFYHLRMLGKSTGYSIGTQPLSSCFWAEKDNLTRFYCIFVIYFTRGNFLVTSSILLHWNKERLLLNHTYAYRMFGLETRVSIQGVKSLLGDRIVFPRLGTGDTDRWRINLCLCATCQCPQCPISEKRHDPPKVI